MSLRGIVMAGISFSAKTKEKLTFRFILGKSCVVAAYCANILLNVNLFIVKVFTNYRCTLSRS
jgi:hypothetical protein